MKYLSMLFCVSVLIAVGCSGRKAITVNPTNAETATSVPDMSGPTLATTAPVPPPPIPSLSPSSSPIALPTVTDTNTQTALWILRSMIQSQSQTLQEHATLIGELEGKTAADRQDITKISNRVAGLEQAHKPFCHSELFDGPVSGKIPVKYYQCKRPGAVMRDCYSYFANGGDGRCGTFITTSDTGVSGCYTGGCAERSGQSWRVQLLCCESTVSDELYTIYQADSGNLISTFKRPTPLPQ